MFMGKRSVMTLWTTTTFGGKGNPGIDHVPLSSVIRAKGFKHWPFKNTQILITQKQWYPGHNDWRGRIIITGICSSLKFYEV